MRVRLALLCAVVLVLTACTGDEIEGFLDLIPSSDLSESDDPGERAAGASATEVLAAAEAEENLERGIEEGDLDAIRQAQRLRPDDSKYDIYEAALLAGEDLGEDAVAAGSFNDAMQRAGTEFARERSDVDDALARGRMGVEAFMDALLIVIERSPAGPATVRRIEAYCAYVTGYYPETYTDKYPQQVAFYLAVEADLTLCP